MRTFFWTSEGACYAKGIKFKAPTEGFEISPLAPAPVGFNEEELQNFLQENNVSLDGASFMATFMATFMAFFVDGASCMATFEDITFMATFMAIFVDGTFFMTTNITYMKLLDLLAYGFQWVD